MQAKARARGVLSEYGNPAAALLAPGGDLLMKLLDCPEAQRIANELRRHFDKAGGIGVRASRKGSKERYFLARGYAGS